MVHTISPHKNEIPSCLLSNRHRTLNRDLVTIASKTVFFDVAVSAYPNGLDDDGGGAGDDDDHDDGDDNDDDDGDDGDDDDDDADDDADDDNDDADDDTHD